MGAAHSLWGAADEADMTGENFDEWQLALLCQRSVPEIGRRRDSESSVDLSAASTASIEGRGEEPAPSLAESRVLARAGGVPGAVAEIGQAEQRAMSRFDLPVRFNKIRLLELDKPAREPSRKGSLMMELSQRDASTSRRRSEGSFKHSGSFKKSGSFKQPPRMSEEECSESVQNMLSRAMNRTELGSFRG